MNLLLGCLLVALNGQPNLFLAVVKPEARPPAAETLRLPLATHWQAAIKEKVAPGQALSITQYLPAGANPLQPPESLTVLALNRRILRTNARGLWEHYLKVSEQDCPGAVVLLHQDASSVLFERLPTVCASVPQTHELVRIIDGRTTQFHLTYTARKGLWTARQRDEWVGRLMQVGLMPPAERR